MALKKIYILCNGELAEPLYFQDFKDHLKMARRIVIKYKAFAGKAPADFIKAAVKLKNELIAKGDFSEKDKDEIWCVFDIDNFWKDNKKDSQQGIILAQTNDVKIAWSNECFELWFLYHFSVISSSIPRSDYHNKLEKLFRTNGLGNYTKNMEGVFAKLLKYQDSAIKNAKQNFVEGEIENNPSTAIFKLVEELKNLGK